MGETLFKIFPVRLLGCYYYHTKNSPSSHLVLRDAKKAISLFCRWIFMSRRKSFLLTDRWK